MKPSETAVPDVVVGSDNVTAVPLTDKTVVPEATPLPTTFIPTLIPAEDSTVSDVELAISFAVVVVAG
jgi:capsular polysaccharide biosynthesis protein